MPPKLRGESVSKREQPTGSDPPRGQEGENRKGPVCLSRKSLWRRGGRKAEARAQGCLQPAIMC